MKDSHTRIALAILRSHAYSILESAQVHQLADSSEKLNNGRFPFAEFIAGLTFILFLCFEEAIHLIFETSHSHHLPAQQRRPSSHSRFECKKDESNTEEHHDHEEETAQNQLHSLLTVEDASDEQLPTTRFQRCNSEDSHVSNESGPSHHHHPSHIEKHLHGSSFASTILLIALCLHSVLAGLSIGIESSTSAITTIAIGILAHKFFAAFALGSTMVAANIPRNRHIKLGLVFASSTPIGILLGMLAANFFHISDVTKGIAEAAVGGTFLYISIVEIGIKELLICRDDPVKVFDRSDRSSVKKEEVCKLIFLIFGYGAMSVLALWV